MTSAHRVAVFDLDGTLADTAPDLIGAMNDLADREPGLARLEAGQERTTAGRGGRALIRRSIELAGVGPEETRVDALFPLYLEAYGARLREETTLFAGAEACLDALKAEGWRLAICTNKPEELARRLLDALGVGAAFESLIGADTLATRKPDPAPLFEAARRAAGDGWRAVMIGDTRTDRETARRARSPCVLCRFGYSDEPVDAFEPEGVVDALSEVPRLVGSLVR